MTRRRPRRNSKITVKPAERQRLQSFYRDVLGCKVVTKSHAADLIQLGSNFYIGVNCDEAALNDSDGEKAIWLELRADDAKALRQEILKFGVKGIEFWDKEHPIFGLRADRCFAWRARQKTCRNGSNDELSLAKESLEDCEAHTWKYVP